MKHKDAMTEIFLLHLQNLLYNKKITVHNFESITKTILLRKKLGQLGCTILTRGKIEHSYWSIEKKSQTLINLVEKKFIEVDK